MVFADDIRRIILKLAEESGPDKSFGPIDVAQKVDKKNWQSLMDQVSLVATILEKEGRIKTTHSAGQIESMRWQQHERRERHLKIPVHKSSI